MVDAREDRAQTKFQIQLGLSVYQNISLTRHSLLGLFVCVYWPVFKKCMCIYIYMSCLRYELIVTKTLLG